MLERLLHLAGNRTAARRTLALAAGSALLAALPYLFAGVGDSFIRLDDPGYITDNPQVLRGLSAAGARWALTSSHYGNWHPMTWLSHMLDVTLFDLDARGHHGTSILLHALNAGLLFVALRCLTGALARSAFVAALFGVHPLRVESVAWVAERKDLLAGLFFMLVLLVWERYARRGGAGRYLAALALFALGLASKPMLVTLPFVLLLLDLWPLGRAPLPGRDGRARTGWAALLIEKLPFLALALASSAVTLLAQRSGGALADAQHLGLGARLANAAVSCAYYLGAVFWPARLAVFYPHPASSIAWPAVAGSSLLLALISFAALRQARARPFLAAGWCWFLGMLVPVIGLVQVGGQARADRYTYLPLIGVFLAAAWLAADRLPAALRRPRVLGPLAAGLVAAFAAGSAVQAGHWRDSETLFRRTLAVTKDNWLIQDSLGVVLSDSGRHEEAISHYREALRVWPDFAESRYNLGISLAALGRHGEAAAQYREAVQVDPGHADAHHNLGATLAQLGQHEEAIAQYREALRLKPDNADARNNLGISLAALGRHAEAIAQYQKAIRIRPGYAEARNNLGVSLASLGHLTEAARVFREVTLLAAGSAEAWTNLGFVLAALGRSEEAASGFREAIRIAPDHAKARAGLAGLERRDGPP